VPLGDTKLIYSLEAVVTLAEPSGVGVRSGGGVDVGVRVAVEA
jgi:hypothetical protein